MQAGRLQPEQQTQEQLMQAQQAATGNALINGCSDRDEGIEDRSAVIEAANESYGVVISEQQLLQSFLEVA